MSKSKIRIPSGRDKPTLPLSQIFGEENATDVAPIQPAPFRDPHEPGHRPRNRPPVTLIEGVPTYAYPNGAVPGPAPPKSWSPLFDSDGFDERTTAEWRRHALSLFFSQFPIGTDLDDSMPPLTQLCIRVLLKNCSSPEELVEYSAFISPHLRRTFIRWRAVHQPLSTAELYSLCAEEGHAEGELIVVGPEATLRLTHIRKLKSNRWIRSSTLSEEEDEEEEQSVEESLEGLSIDDQEEEEAWERTSSNVPPPLISLVLLRTRLSTPSVLPPTLTHLALLDLPRPVYVHHLPRICPLIEVLDLSYNIWLSDSSSDGTFDRTEWKKWRNLRILGLRECGITEGETARVNEQRWTDVKIIGL